MVAIVIQIVHCCRKVQIVKRHISGSGQYPDGYTEGYN